MAAVIVLYALIWLGVLALGVVCWVKIFTKAGFSGWWAALMFVPVANLVAFIYLAFATWPIEMASRSWGYGPPSAGPRPYPAGPSYSPPPAAGGWPPAASYPPAAPYPAPTSYPPPPGPTPSGPAPSVPPPPVPGADDVISRLGSPVSFDDEDTHPSI